MVNSRAVRIKHARDCERQHALFMPLLCTIASGNAQQCCSSAAVPPDEHCKRSGLQRTLSQHTHTSQPNCTLKYRSAGVGSKASSMSLTCDCCCCGCSWSCCAWLGRVHLLTRLTQLEACFHLDSTPPVLPPLLLECAARVLGPPCAVLCQHAVQVRCCCYALHNGTAPAASARNMKQCTRY